MSRRVLLCCVLVLALGWGSGFSRWALGGTSPLKVERVDAAGLDNVFRISDRLCSGSSPEGDAGFASLKKLGVRTVLSVDGAAPDLERARRHGLRYVHLPIGYDSVPEEQALKL